MVLDAGHPELLERMGPVRRGSNKDRPRKPSPTSTGMIPRSLSSSDQHPLSDRQHRARK